MSRVVRIAVCVLLLLVVLGGKGWTASNSSEASESPRVSSSADDVSQGKATLFLSGVVIYGENRSALFEIERGNQTAERQVKEGEKIGGYTLDKVEKDRVFLEYKGRKEVLLLKRGRLEIATAKRAEKIEDTVGEKKKLEEKGSNSTVAKRYAPGEINLDEHRDEVKQGILEMIKTIPNPMSLGVEGND